MLATFGLLALSISLVWLPTFRVGDRLVVSPWFLAAALGSLVAVLNGYVAIVGLAELVALGVTCHLFSIAKSRASRWLSGIVLTILALALALHRLPGFSNPVLWSDVHFSAGAKAVTQYINYDKGAVGLLLLAIVAPRCRSFSEFRMAFKQSWLPAFMTIAAVLSAAVAIDVVRIDPKWSQYTLPFLAINLFFTCVTEETFFRGFLQERLHATLGPSQRSTVITVLVSGVLFGATHLGGGVAYAALASLAGIGYATVYARSKRIEPAILTHFGLNAMHFLFFTYPFLQKA